MKWRSGEVQGRAVTETVDDIRMTNAVERNGLILKILNQRALKVCIGNTLQENIQHFDNDSFRLAFNCAQITRHIDFGVAAAPQTFKYLVATVEQ